MWFVWPAALWWLVAVPVLFLLEVLARRPRRVVVPAVSLWRGLSMPADAASRRRTGVAASGLYLRLAAVAIAVLAAAGPFIPMAGGGAVRAVVDASPSMMARTPDGRVRLDCAREIARATATVVEETSGDLAAAAMAARSAGGAVMVVTDDPEAVIVPPGVTVVGVGGRLENVGIAALSAESRQGDGIEAFVRLVHRGQVQARVRLRMTTDVGITIDREVDVPADGGIGMLVMIDGDARSVRAEITRIDGGDDDLAADDLAEVVKEDAGPVTWQIYGRQAAAIRRAFESDPLAGEAQFGVTPDCAVGIGERPPEARLVVLVDLPGHEQWTGGEIRWMPGPLGDMPQDPFVVERAAVVDGVPLLMAGGQTVAAWRRGGDGQDVVDIGFDPDRGGDWPDRVSFPVFWGRVLRRAAGLASRDFRSVAGVLDEGESMIRGKWSEPMMLPRGIGGSGIGFAPWLALGALGLLLLGCRRGIDRGTV